MLEESGKECSLPMRLTHLLMLAATSTARVFSHITNILHITQNENSILWEES
jgi:hypothetical protein